MLLLSCVKIKTTLVLLIMVFFGILGFQQQVGKEIEFGTGIWTSGHAEKRRKQLPQVSHQLNTNVVMMLVLLCILYSIYKYIYSSYICSDIKDD